MLQTPIPLSVTALALTLLLGSPGRTQDQKNLPLQPGAPAPDFASLGLDGKEVKLSDFKDKVVILDFWATWCAPCQQAMPHVQAVAKDHAAKGVVVLAVCTSDTRAKFDEWVPKNREKYPDVVFAMDPHERGSATFEQRASAKHYRVAGLPTKFVIGRDGKVAATIVGYEEGDVRLEAGLAAAGLLIDPALVETGKKQIAKAAADEARRAAMALANPPPLFMNRLGKHVSGAALPDFAMRDAGGKELKLSTLRGNPVVFAFGWPGIEQGAQIEDVAKRFGPYGVKLVVLHINTSVADFETWCTEKGSKFPALLAMDPAGKYVPTGDKPDPKEHMEFFAKTTISQLTGGPTYGFPGLPFWLVVDGEGRFVGLFRNVPQTADALPNLLLRAGVKLSEADMPKQVAPDSAYVPPAPEPRVEGIKLGSVAPDFAMQTLDGKTVKLADHKGKVVVLDFWATWCGPCKEALPHVDELAKKYRDQDVVVIASCTSDPRASFESWLGENGAKYPNVIFAHDAAEKSPERASRKLYGVSGIPASFVIDRTGKVVAKVDGYMQGEVLLDAALAEAGVKVDQATLDKAVADRKKREESRR